MRNLSRRSYLLLTLSLALGAMGLATPAAAEEPKLKAGDKIVFLGDSITEAGAAPGGYVTLVREAINAKLKDQNIHVIGAGISGNKVPDLEKRLDRDVLAHKPNVVVIYIGINDVWHSQTGNGTSKEDFDAGLRRIIKRITEAGGRVILSTASVIGEKAAGTNPLDKMLGEYCDISKHVAKETKTQLIELRKQMVDYLKVHNKDDADKNQLTTDGVHLNAAGNQFVSERMLEALGVNAAATTDSTKGKVLRHFVIFKFKDEVKPAQVQEVVDAFAALPSKIDAIIDFEKGTDVGIEMKADGFTHGFLVTFADEKGREIYLPHPAHQEFVKLVGPRVDKVLVFDYWTK